MNDLISREAALKAVNAYDYRGFTVEQVKTITDGCAEELRKLPVVDAEPVRHGTWELVPVGVNGHITVYHGCSVCGCVVKSPPRYCPNCGAKMEGNDT